MCLIHTMPADSSLIRALMRLMLWPRTCTLRPHHLNPPSLTTLSHLPLEWCLLLHQFTFPGFEGTQSSTHRLVDQLTLQKEHTFSCRQTPFILKNITFVYPGLQLYGDSITTSQLHAGRKTEAYSQKWYLNSSQKLWLVLATVHRDFQRTVNVSEITARDRLTSNKNQVFLITRKGKWSM